MMHLKLAMTTAVLVVAGVASAATRTWTGGGDDALASTDANWQEGARPQDGDDIVLNSGSAAMTWDLNISVASWTQDGYTGTVTFETDYSDFAEFIITGNCSFNSGTWTHVANGTTQTKRLSVSVGGNLTMGSSAKIDVTGLGYTAIANQPNYSLKTGNLTVEGGAYGGYAADNSNQYGHLPPYGSYRLPVDCGCPGNRSGKSMGGGAVKLTVGGAFSFGGKITADAVYDSVVNYEGGSGGGVLITASSISGAGTISANASKSRGSGSGGRISVILTGTGADFSNYDIASKASATSKCGITPRDWDHGAIGTIYAETAADVPGQGWMIFKGIDITPSDPMRYGTPFTPEVKDLTFAKITLRNTGILAVRAGETLHVENTVFDCADTSLNYIYVDGGAVDYGASGVVRGPIKYASGLDYKGDFTIGDGTSLTIAGESKVTGSVTVLAGGSLTWNGVGAVGGSVVVSGTMAFNKPTTIAGDVTVQSGGKLTHSANSTTEENKLNLTVGGSVTVAEGGAIDVSAMGYALGQGPGASSGNCGASYGGRGHGAAASTPKACYGSILCPTNCGSGGNSSRVANRNGGGAAIIRATGLITVNGEVNADCPDIDAAAVFYTSSGGSIWLTGSSVDGTGSIHANGGGASNGNYGSKYYLGGGGRISLVSTVATEDSTTLTVTAYGGTTPEGYFDGSVGTIYRENASQEPGHGTVTIANAREKLTKAGDHYTDWEYTDFPSAEPGLVNETQNVTVKVTNHGRLNIVADATVADVTLLNEGTNAKSYLLLDGHTLSVKAKRHAISPDDATQVVPGDGGSVYWIPRGFMLFLR